MNLPGKALAVLLACAILMSAVPPVQAAEEKSVTLTVEQLREKFPAGKYWNHADNPGASNDVNNQDGWTEIPCPDHNETIETDAQTCNGFMPADRQLSWQCMGFAEKLAYDATGYNPRVNKNGWCTYTNKSSLDSVKPGDIVRYKNHSIYVIGVDGDTITYADCNSGGTCVIRWDQTISKQVLAASFVHLRSAPSAMDNTPADCGCSADYAGTYLCKLNSGTLNMRSGHGTEYDVVASIPKDAIVTVTKADGQWAHVEYNGVSGYASFAYLELIEPAETEPEPTQPKPTEPKPTEPKPTEPKPTEPKPTEPKPTEPKPTEPEESLPECGCSTKYAGSYTCTAQGGLWIRSDHSTNSEKISSIPNGATVYVSMANSGWAHVEYNGKSGYASMQYLRRNSAESAVSYNIRLVEPWALRINVMFGDAGGSTVNVSSMASFGAYAIRGSLLDATDVTAEALMADADTVHFSGKDGTMTASGTWLTFDFFEGLYTYRMSDPIYWVAYYVDADGHIHYSAVRSKSLHDQMVENNGKSGFKAEEKAVYTDMLTLEERILSYRADYDGATDVVLQNTDTLASTPIAFGADRNGSGQVKFGSNFQISLVEPWGVKLNTAMKNGDAMVDFATADDYGVIVYQDKRNKVSGTLTADALLKLDKANTYVFSKSQGTMDVVGGMAAAIYNEGIYTFELDLSVYYMFYLEVDGKYYYANVRELNLYDEMESRLAGITKLTKELSVYETMLCLCDSVKVYRAKL